MSLDLSSLAVPIVQAPMAGGPSTPELAAAVSEAGGLGFLAAGYKPPDKVAEELEALRGLTDRPFGVNVFAPPQAAPDQGQVAAYARRISSEAARWGVEVGEPRHDSDWYDEKVALVLEHRVPIASFTFGLPDASTIGALHEAGTSVVVTVTRPDEAVAAERAGVDALVVQGWEAGGHRGGFVDDGSDDVGVLALLRLVATRTTVPLVAAGGIMDGPSVAAVLAAGATAAQLGTALLLCPESATSAAHRKALGRPRPTVVTRAFTGRSARGLLNRFHEEYAGHAPAAYPDVHHLTAPLRAASRGAEDPEGINLWAGQGYELAREVPAGDLVREIHRDALAALRRALGSDGS